VGNIRQTSATHFRNFDRPTTFWTLFYRGNSVSRACQIFLVLPHRSNHRSGESSHERVSFCSLLCVRLLNSFLVRIWVDRDRLRLEAVALSLPEVLSRCGTSAELVVFLKNTQLTNKPWIDKEWPDDDWEALVYNTKQDCEAYHKSVLVEGWNIGSLYERAQRFLFSFFRIWGS
jgi:hypothetical protein